MLYTAPGLVDHEAVPQAVMSRSQQAERSDVGGVPCSSRRASFLAHETDIAFGEDEAPAYFPPLCSRTESSLRGPDFDDFQCAVEVEEAGGPLTIHSEVSIDETYESRAGESFQNSAAGRVSNGNTVDTWVDARGPREGVPPLDLRRSRPGESGRSAHSMQMRKGVEKVTCM